VQPLIVLEMPPFLNDQLGLLPADKPFPVQALSRSLPLKLSMKPFCHGLPGLM
jgi:hypothetical protein